MAVTIGGSTVTFNDNSVQNTAATGFGFKNRIINGDMRIDQRNAGAAITPTSSVFNVDRFLCELTTASALTFQQVSDAPVGFTKSLKITVATTATILAGTNNNLGQSIEGFNIADLGWGTANASPVTLSFWAKSSVVGTYSAHIRNIGDAYFYIATYTINVANTWEYKTITISGPTIGTWNDSNSRGMLLQLVGLGVGSTFEGTAGSWQAGVKCGTSGSIDFAAQASGATFYITGVQLEKGSTATSFDYRPYGTELALCQRYFESIQLIAAQTATTGHATETTSALFPILFKTTKRSAPSFSSVGTLIILRDAGSSAGGSFAIAASSIDAARIDGTGASALTIGSAVSLFCNSASCALNFTAEL